jgi:hypothetical protein
VLLWRETLQPGAGREGVANLSCGEEGGNQMVLDIFLLMPHILMLTETDVRQLGNFWYILIPEIIYTFMTNISDPVRAKYVHVFKLNFK